MNILVTTSDKNMHLLRGFAHLFNKYFSMFQPVTVLGYAKPNFDLPRNFTFVSLGRQQDYPFRKWSDALLDFLSVRPDWDTFMLLLEDYYLVRAVDVWGIELLYTYMREHRNVLKMDISADRLGSGSATDFAYLDDFDLIRSDPDSQYHWSWWPGIWNRDALFKVMLRGESCHEEELYGGPRVKEAELDVLGTRQYPLRAISVYKYNEPGIVRLDGLRETDKRELVALGYLEGIST